MATLSTFAHDVTMPQPVPARNTCIRVGTEAGSSSCALMKNLYDEKTRPFMNAHVA
jgi:hypothetical protein